MERRTLSAWKKGVYRIYDADLDGWYGERVRKGYRKTDHILPQGY
jgi:hypothetical protein